MRGRVGPNELSISAPEAVSQILALGSKCKKTIWYECIAIPNKALNLERDKATHDARRKVWDRGFSAKGGCFIQTVDLASKGNLRKFSSFTRL